MLTSQPHTEVLYIGDFNMHHTDWLQSTHTDVGGIEAFHFSIPNELEQIIKHPTVVPDHHDHAAKTLNQWWIKGVGGGGGVRGGSHGPMPKGGP